MCVACNHTIHRAQHNFGWNKDFSPALVAKPGETILFECLDSSGGQLGPDATLDTLANLDFGKINPVSGPVYVEGAEPGDALKVTIRKFHPSGHGWTANIPGFGLLADHFKDPALHVWKYDAATMAPSLFGPGGRVPLGLVQEMGMMAFQPVIKGTRKPEVDLDLIKRAVTHYAANGYTTASEALVRDIDCDVGGHAGQGTDPQRPSQVVHEDDLARPQAGPHGGAGPTTAYPFFADAEGLPFVLRKRVLHKGAGIGLHPQHKDEIYYIVSGQGSYVLDGKQYDVRAGHALLTRKGSSHALQQVGDEDLVVLLAYPR